MQKLTFINDEGKTLKLFDNPHVLFDSIEGLERIAGVNETSQAVRQDGTTLEYTSFDERPITLKFAVKGKTYEEYLAARDEALAAFNPKSVGVLYYENKGIFRTLVCKADETPNMPINGIQTWTKCEVYLTANDPMLYNQFTTSEEISTWIGGLKFPFKLPFHLKRRGEPRVNIINNGHVETPVQIIFKGPAYNPTVKLLQTGEYIRVKRELTSDDTLYIDTTFGVNSVEIERDGVRENAFSAIDWRSDFFKLRVGDNLVEYTTENQLVPQSVEIRFRERYLGA